MELWRYRISQGNSVVFYNLVRDFCRFIFFLLSRGVLQIGIFLVKQGISVNWYFDVKQGSSVDFLFFLRKQRSSVLDFEQSDWVLQDLKRGISVDLYFQNQCGNFQNIFCQSWGAEARTVNFYFLINMEVLLISIFSIEKCFSVFLS